VVNNTAIGNDVGIYSLALNASCDPPAKAINNVISGNTLQDNADNNTSGDAPTTGYQAGILDESNGDRIIGNQICGLGYQTTNTAAMVSLPIDTTDTNNVVVAGNTGCFSVTGPQPHGHGHHFPTWY
jgi:hypothetical protein